MFKWSYLCTYIDTFALHSYLGFLQLQSFNASLHNLSAFHLESGKYRIVGVGVGGGRLA